MHLNIVQGAIMLILDSLKQSFTALDSFELLWTVRNNLKQKKMSHSSQKRNFSKH